LVILQLISTAFNLLGLNPFLTLAIWGGTLIVTVGFSLLRDSFALLIRMPGKP
jgi:ribose/xylose/arabinose/galactoside ABC-type transport system permease subunit